jgi:hypothetical protein
MSNIPEVPRATQEIADEALRLATANEALAKVNAQAKALREVVADSEGKILSFLTKHHAPLTVAVPLGQGLTGAIVEGKKTSTFNEESLLAMLTEYFNGDDAKAGECVDFLYDSRTTTLVKKLKFVDANAKAQKAAAAGASKRQRTK